ncbi:MAG TPA: hypothetical protein PKM69_09200 [Bacteroidales bacterium]|nr:hypothetical protein [Bacteroidales bacterium]
MPASRNEIHISHFGISLIIPDRDNGATGNNGCALFDRESYTVFDQQALDALVQGSLK